MGKFEKAVATLSVAPELKTEFTILMRKFIKARDSVDTMPSETKEKIMAIIEDLREGCALGMAFQTEVLQGKRKDNGECEKVFEAIKKLKLRLGIVAGKEFAEGFFCVPEFMAKHVDIAEFAKIYYAISNAD